MSDKRLHADKIARIVITPPI